MAKESGLGMSVAVDDSAGSARTITSDVTNLAITMASTIQDVTTVGDSAMARLLLLADLQVVFNGVFDDGSNLAHAVFKDYRTNAGTELGRTIAIVHSGQTLAEPALMLTNFDYTRDNGGALLWTSTGMLADGTVPAWS